MSNPLGLWTSVFVLLVYSIVPHQPVSAVTSSDGKQKVATTGATGNTVVDSRDNYCSRGKKQGGGKLSWTKPMGDAVFSCQHHFMQLWCCAEGYSSIRWKRKEGNSTEWKPVTFDTEEKISFPPSSKGQQLLIRNTIHNSVYQCEAVGSKGGKISHNYYLIVQDCNSYSSSSKPVIGEPLQNNTAIFKNSGEDIAISCLVSFGPKCNAFVLNGAIEWYGFVNGSCLETLLTTTQGEKDTRGQSDSPLNLRHQYLNLSNLTKSDFRRYCCKANSGTASSPIIMKVVELVEGPAPGKVIMQDPPQIKLMLAIIISAFMLTIIVLVLLWYYRLDIRQFIHIKYGGRSSHQGNANYAYDIILIHSGTRRDYPFIRYILYYTLRKSYSVYLPEEAMDLDEYVDEAYIFAMRGSRKIIMILSEDFLTQTIWGQVHDYLLNERRTDVIYIQHGRINPDLWKNNEYIGNIDVLQRAVKSASRSFLGLGKKLNWPANFTESNNNRQRPVIENTAYSKQIGKFWGQLSLYLPPIRRPESDGGNSTSLTNNIV